jgi:hypothetical protein
MQQRCTYCQTMFAIGREEKLIAIQNMNEENLEYYHAHCPKCRRANRVERAKLEHSYPNWKVDLETMTREASKITNETAEPAVPANKKTDPAVKKPSAARKK